MKAGAAEAGGKRLLRPRLKLCGVAAAALLLGGWLVAAVVRVAVWEIAPLGAAPGSVQGVGWWLGYVAYELRARWLPRCVLAFARRSHALCSDLPGAEPCRELIPSMPQFCARAAWPGDAGLGHLSSRRKSPACGAQPALGGAGRGVRVL